MTVGLLSLPQELLRRVVDLMGTTKREDDECYNRYCVQNPWASKQENAREALLSRKRLQTICNLRLVNWRFNDAASHALVPTLKIQLSEESLGRTEKLLAIPHVASGVYTVRVSTAYCHGVMANDLEAFAQNKRLEFDSWEERYNEARASNHLLPYFQRGDSRCWKKAQAKLLNLCLAWGEVEYGEIVPCSEYPLYRAMIEQGFKRFISNWQEQQHLIKSGRFATKLASLLATLPRLKSLYIEDTAGDQLREQEKVQAIPALPENEVIINIMAKPERWDFIIMEEMYLLWSEEDSQEDDQITAAALLCDIPIALHRANVQLDHLYIHCFPPDHNMKYLDPVNCFLQGSAMELRQIASSGTDFHFKLNFRWDSSMQVESTGQRRVLDYLLLCSIGVSLQTWNIQLDSLLLIDIGETENPVIMHYILGKMAVARLDRADVSSTSVFRTKMKSIIQEPGPHTIVWCHTRLYICTLDRGMTINRVLSSLDSRSASKMCLLEIFNKIDEQTVCLLEYRPSSTSGYR